MHEMKGEDPSNSQDQQVDTISVDFIAILTKVVEDNDSLQKRIEAIEKCNLLRRIEALEKCNLLKRIEALEKSFTLFANAQQENEGLQTSMSKLITMLQDSDLRKGYVEPRKDYRRSVNHSHNEFTNDDGQAGSHVLSGSCKRFKTNDVKMKSSCKNYREGSSHEVRTSPSRHKHDDRLSRLFNKSARQAGSDHLDHHSRRSYDAERPSLERSRVDVDSSQRSSAYRDSKLVEERYRVVERLGSSERRKRPRCEDRQSGENSLRENRDSKQPGENRLKDVTDCKQPEQCRLRLRLIKESKQSDNCRLRENKHCKPLSSYRIKEYERTDCRVPEKSESKQPDNGRIKETKELHLSKCRTIENEPKENKEFNPPDDSRIKENKEVKQPTDCRTKESKESKRSGDSRMRKNRETKHSSDCHMRESKDSKQPNDSRTEECRESKQPSDRRLSEGELSGDDHPRENEDLSQNNPKSSESRNDGPIDPRLTHCRTPKVDIPSPMLPTWCANSEIDFRKIYSTPSKFLNSLPSFLSSYSIISPLPTTPDQLKEKFREQGTIKVPMPSFINDDPFEEKEANQPNEEVKEVVEVKPEQQDRGEVRTVTETEDVEHGVFKRRRRVR